MLSNIHVGDSSAFGSLRGSFLDATIVSFQLLLLDLFTKLTLQYILMSAPSVIPLAVNCKTHTRIFTDKSTADECIIQLCNRMFIFRPT